MQWQGILAAVLRAVLPYVLAALGGAMADQGLLNGEVGRAGVEAIRFVSLSSSPEAAPVGLSTLKRER